MSTGRYILDENNNPVLADLFTWSRWFETSAKQRVVACDNVNGFLVSTVFLSLDHNFGGIGLPVLWETMIFPDKKVGIEEWVNRYTSYENAVSGHQNAVCLIKSGKFNKEKE